VKGDRPDRTAEHKKKTMKTNIKNTKKGLLARPDQLQSTNNNTAAAEQQEPRGLLRIDFEQRQFNRSLPTNEVLDLVHRRLRHAFDFAEVVGKWVWITFPEPQEQQVTAELSQLGFHWNSRRKVWQHPCGVFKGEPTDPRTKYQTARAQEVAA
jgi:hypothetical protein